VSPVSSNAFKVVSRSLKEALPDILVAPMLMIANTDTRWYWDLTPNIFRVCPMRMVSSDMARIHGVNERLAIDNYLELIRFYRQIIVHAQQDL